MVNVNKECVTAAVEVLGQEQNTLRLLEVSVVEEVLLLC